VVLLTKLDLLGPGDPIPQLDAPGAAGVLAVSSASGQGIEELKEYLWKFVEQARSTVVDTAEAGLVWLDEDLE
jgi:hypothetical protein